METRSTSFRRLSVPFEASLMLSIHSHTQLHFYKTHTCLSLFFLSKNGSMHNGTPCLRLTSSNLVYTNLQLQRWHNNGTWDTQPRLFPWQPSQRITILQHTTPPTTLAALHKRSSFSLSSSAVWRLWVPHQAFWRDLATCPDQVAFLLLWSGRKMNRYQRLFITRGNTNLKCHICIGNICGGEVLLLMLLLYSLVRKYICKVNKPN